MLCFVAKKTKKYFLQAEDAFTLIEILITIAILAVVIGVGFLNLANYKNKNTFDLDAQNVLEAIRNGENKALLGAGGTGWGIKFTSDVNDGYYEIFSGSSYATSSVVTRETLTGSTLFANPAAGFSKTITFAPLTGVPSQAESVVLKRSGGTDRYLISLSTLGSLDKVYEQGLVGYWPLDEGLGTTAYDASGGGNNGSFVGSPSWVAGRIGGAVNCGNTTSDYINVGSVPLGSIWTITAWFQYPLSTTGSSWNTLTRGSSYDHQIIVQRSSGQLGMYDNKNGTGFNGSGYYMTSLSNGWHFIATIGNAGVEQFYIDGSYVGQSVKQSTSDVKSICNYWGGGQNWGIVDDVRIYNRALSATEIQQMYQRY